MRKREAATNQPKAHAHIDQLCSLSHRGFPKPSSGWHCSCPGCRHRPDPLPAPPGQANKLPWKHLPVALLTFILECDSRLPCLSCQELHWLPKAGHQPWPEALPWVWGQAQGLCPPFLCNSQRSALPLTRSSLLLLAGWVSPPTWWQQKIPVRNQKNKPHLHSVNTWRMDRKPARSQELSDIPKAWDYTWIRKESFSLEQDCAKEKFFFILGVQDLMISSSFHFLKCRVRV